MEEYVGKALAPATTAGYKRAFRSWKEAAEERGWESLPATPENFASFLAQTAKSGTSKAQISMLVAAIAHEHARHSVLSPTTNPIVKKVIEGIKRDQARPCVTREPLSFELLKELAAIARESGTLKHWRTVWRAYMQFYGLLRWDEVSQLTKNDLIFKGDCMDIHIRRSKTDQHWRGATVRIARQPEDPTHCPVKITQMYITALRYEHGGQVLCSLQPRIGSNGGHQRGIPGTKISYTNALQDMRDLISRTGRDGSKYGEHSGRRGGATAAAEAGVRWTDLKKHGRWASDSAPQRYVEESERSQSVVPRLLAQAANTPSISTIIPVQSPRHRPAVQGPSVPARDQSGPAKKGTISDITAGGEHVNGRRGSPPSVLGQAY